MSFSEFKKENIFELRLYLGVFVIAILVGIISGEILGACLLALVLIIWMFLRFHAIDIISRRKHRRVFRSQLFRDVRNKLGFIEASSEGVYELIGEYNGYATRVYYNWSKMARGFMSFGDIAIVLLYEPTYIEGTERIDEKLLDEINSTGTAILHSKKVFKTFRGRYYIKQINYYRSLKYVALLKEIEYAFQDVKNADRKPISLAKYFEIKELKKRELQYEN